MYVRTRNGISQPRAEWTKAKEMSGTMMTMIGHIEPHSREIIIFREIHLHGKLLDAFLVELWLCAHVSRQQTWVMLDLCEGNHWIRHLTRAFTRLAQLKLFHFAWSIWKWKKCTQFIFMSAVEPLLYCAVHKNAWFSLWPNDENFHKSKQGLRSGLQLSTMYVWNGNYCEWIELKLIFVASRTLRFSIRRKNLLSMGVYSM